MKTRAARPARLRLRVLRVAAREDARDALVLVEEAAQPRELLVGALDARLQGTLPSGTPIAVKRFGEQLDWADETSRAQWRTEVDVLSTLAHPNIVQLLVRRLVHDSTRSLLPNQQRLA